MDNAFWERQLAQQHRRANVHRRHVDLQRLRDVRARTQAPHSPPHQVDVAAALDARRCVLTNDLPRALFIGQTSNRDVKQVPRDNGGWCAACTPTYGRLTLAEPSGLRVRTVMGTSTSTRRSGGHHMNVTFSMTSDTALMWMTLGCKHPKAFSASHASLHGCDSAVGCH